MTTTNPTAKDIDVPTKPITEAEEKAEFFKHFRGRDRSDMASGKYITLTELWRWLRPKLQTAREQGRDEERAGWYERLKNGEIKEV